jgi:preprotein translocase SecE subunit
VARQVSSLETPNDNETLVRIFFRGFMMPLKAVGRALAWTSHQPPLKQVGHGLKWFFNLRFVRFIGRIIGFSYIRGSWRELKQVTWPSRNEGRRLTTAVILFSIVFGLLIALVDFGLDKLFKDLLLK